LFEFLELDLGGKEVLLGGQAGFSDIREEEGKGGRGLFKNLRTYKEVSSIFYLFCHVLATTPSDTIYAHTCASFTQTKQLWFKAK
jgi:hypothetical protein